MRDCGLYVHRAWLLILILWVPIAISFCFADRFLIALGIDQETAALTQTFLYIRLPNVLLGSMSDTIDMFLVSMGFNDTTCIM